MFVFESSSVELNKDKQEEEESKSLKSVENNFKDMKVRESCNFN